MSEQGIFTVIIQLGALKTVMIDNKDIFDCYFNEDIYSVCCFGKLTLTDKYGLKEMGPLTGSEKILIAFGKSSIQQREFSLLRIGKISSTTGFKQGQASVIELYFTDSYYKNLTSLKFSKAWGTKVKASDVISDLVKNMLQVTSTDLNIETSDTYLENFCMPYWTPIETIRWISNRSKGTKGKCNYGYLFFSSGKKYINFVTLDSLFNSADIDSDIYVLETTQINNDNRVLSWQQNGVDNQGMKEFGGGALLGFDTKTKTMIGIEPDESFVYATAVKELSSLGSNSLFTNNNDGVKYNTYMYDLTGESDKIVLKNLFYNNFIRRYALQNCVKLVCQGHNKRYAGQKINIQWPSMTATQLYSSMDSGSYLVKSVLHRFTPLQTPYFIQTLTCIRNAYGKIQGSNTISLNSITDIFKSIFA